MDSVRSVNCNNFYDYANLFNVINTVFDAVKKVSAVALVVFASLGLFLEAACDLQPVMLIKYAKLSILSVAACSICSLILSIISQAFSNFKKVQNERALELQETKAAVGRLTNENQNITVELDETRRMFTTQQQSVERLTIERRDLATELAEERAALSAQRQAQGEDKELLLAQIENREKVFIKFIANVERIIGENQKGALITESSSDASLDQGLTGIITRLESLMEYALIKDAQEMNKKMNEAVADAASQIAALKEEVCQAQENARRAREEKEEALARAELNQDRVRKEVVEEMANLHRAFKEREAENKHALARAHQEIDNVQKRAEENQEKAREKMQCEMAKLHRAIEEREATNRDALATAYQKIEKEKIEKATLSEKIDYMYHEIANLHRAFKEREAENKHALARAHQEIDNVQMEKTEVLARAHSAQMETAKILEKAERKVVKLNNFVAKGKATRLNLTEFVAKVESLNWVIKEVKNSLGLSNVGDVETHNTSSSSSVSWSEWFFGSSKSSPTKKSATQFLRKKSRPLSSASNSKPLPRLPSTLSLSTSSEIFQTSPPSLENSTLSQSSVLKLNEGAIRLSSFSSSPSSSSSSSSQLEAIATSDEIERIPNEDQSLHN